MVMVMMMMMMMLMLMMTILIILGGSLLAVRLRALSRSTTTLHHLNNPTIIKNDNE
jgi:hypothetical protein